MKTTGYALRDAIKQQELLRDTAAGNFNDSLKAFPDEVKPQPEEVVAAYEKAEVSLARLQVAQLRYNLEVTVTVDGKTTTLADAVKVVGHIGRIEKMWKGAISEAANPYAADYRDPTQVRASRRVSSENAMGWSKTYGKKANALRAAIALANGQEVEIKDLDDSLFE